jgi:hypothetical protein
LTTTSFRTTTAAWAATTKQINKPAYKLNYLTKIILLSIKGILHIIEIIAKIKKIIYGETLLII